MYNQKFFVRGHKSLCRIQKSMNMPGRILNMRMAFFYFYRLSLHFFASRYTSSFGELETDKCQCTSDVKKKWILLLSHVSALGWDVIKMTKHIRFDKLH